MTEPRRAPGGADQGLLSRSRSRVTAFLLWRHFVPVTLACALILRIAWVLLNPVTPVSDFEWYLDKAERIAAGQGFTATSSAFPMSDASPSLPDVPGGVPTAFWPVGYPAFLALVLVLGKSIAPSVLLGQLANVLLSVACVYIARPLGRYAFGSEVAGRGAMLFMAVYPSQTAYTSLLSVEVLFLFLLLAGTALLVVPMTASGRWFAWGSAGLVFGLATLTKPQAVLVPMVLLLVIGARASRQALLRFAVVHAVLIAVLIPWTIRNYQAFGQFVFVSNNGGLNLLIGNNQDADGGFVWPAWMQERIGAIPGERARDSAARELAVSYIRSHPGRALALVPAKLYKLYVSEYDSMKWNMQDPGRILGPPFWRAYRVVSQAVYFAVLIAFAAILARRARWRSPEFRVGPATAAYFTLTYLPFFGADRYHFPMVSWMVIYAGAQGALLLARPSSTDLGAA